MCTPGILLAAGNSAGSQRHRLKARRRDPLVISRWHVRLPDLLHPHRVAWSWGTGRHQMLARSPKRNHVRNHVRVGDRGLVGGITRAHCTCCSPRKSRGTGRDRQGSEPTGHRWAPNVGESWDGSPCSIPSQDGQSWRRCGTHPACGQREPEKDLDPPMGRLTPPLHRLLQKVNTVTEVKT